ncbi:MAG: hypothetical protein RIQ79_1006 [Verrucomicrobiota bacterium]
MFWSEQHGEWVLTRHADVRAILRNPAFHPFDLGGAVGAAVNHDSRFPAVRAVAEAMAVTRSDHGHATVRRFLARVMNSRPLTEIAPLVRSVADALLADGVKRGGLDLVKDFADVLPVQVITELLGLPVEDAPFLAECGEGAAITLLNRSSAPADFRAINARIALGLDYLHGQIRERRARPRADGLTRMIQIAPDDLPASDRDLAVQAYFLFMASMDTTTAFLGGALLALVENPLECDRWRRGELEAAAATEELLRFVSPLQMTPRVAGARTEINGRMIEAGQRVMLVLAAANRDPAIYAEPDRLDLGRGGPPHISFGDGAHSCLGAALARLEGQIGFSSFIGLPAWRAISSPQQWLHHDKLRKIQSLSVEFVAK